MKTVAFFISLSLLLTFYSCSEKSGNSVDEKVLRQIDNAIENYVRINMKESTKTVDVQGNIIISDAKRSYVFSAKRAIFGKIDGDEIEDAVVPVKVFTDKIYLISDEIFVALKTGNNFKVVATTDKILKVKDIQDRMIIVDYTDVPIDAPNYGCKGCTDEIKFRLEGSTLVRVEK